MNARGVVRNRGPADTRDPYLYGDTIHDVFARRVALRPDAPAILQGSEVVSYRDLAVAADILAASFLSRGVSPGCFAVVRMRRSPAFVAALLAILKLGAAYLAAEPAWPADYVQRMLDRADAWLVTDDEDLGLRSRRGTLVVATNGLPSGTAAAPPNIRVSRDAPCAIFQTSGSTGAPKLAVVPHRATVRAFIGVDYANFGPGRVIMQAAPVCWDGLTLELWSVLLNGGTSLIPPEDIPVGGDLLRLCSARYGLDTVWLTSSLFGALVDDDIGAFANIRQVMSGGERISPDHVRRLLATHPRVRFSSGYGPVETTVFATSHILHDGDLDLYGEVPLGRPLPATTVMVLDEAGDPCPEGKAGEIYIGGDALGLGYLADTAETKRRFVPGPDGSTLYRTGDLGQWQSGVVLFRGRVDRQLKIRGQRVEPEEVERFIASAQPGLVVAVTPMKDVHGQVVGLAAHCGTAARNVSAAAIMAACQAGLPPHLRPRQIIAYPELPRNDNGKINYDALEQAITPARIRPEAVAGHPGTDPAGDHIIRIASALLGVAVGPSDDLFELGGDSLFAMRLAVRLRQEAGLRLSTGHIHRERAAARLAKFAIPEPSGTREPAAWEAWALNPGEEDLCIHEEIFPGDPSLLVLSAYELSGDVDLEALRAALVVTCTRHPALSSVRIPHAGAVRSHGLTPSQVDRQVQIHREEVVIAEQGGAVVFPAAWLTAFDLGRDMPLRMYLTPRTGQHWQLSLVIHHVAMDGWSEHIFNSALSLAYDEVTGQAAAPERPAAPVVGAQKAAEQERKRAQEYWRAILRGLEPLPVTIPQAGRNSFADICLALTNAECGALAALAGGRDELHAGALAWYADALQHAFSSSDFAIGSAYAARDLTDEETIGYHVQMIPVRIHYAEGSTLACLASDICRQWLSSLDQRSLSLREIAACAPEARARGHRAVFQAGFALQREVPEYLELGGLKHPRIPVRPPAPPFEFYLEMRPGPNGTVAHLQWDDNCVPAGAGQRVAERLRSSLAKLG